MAKRTESEPAAEAAGKRAGARGGPEKAATPWGSARVVEEARVAQRAGDKRFSSILQLLENDRGEPLVRIAYATVGVARRGPVTLRPRDVEKLRASLQPGSALAAVLGWSPEAEGSGGDA
jgi:hypothetical protein